MKTLFHLLGFVRRTKVRETRCFVSKYGRREGKYIVVFGQGFVCATGNIKWAMKPIYCPLYALNMGHFLVNPPHMDIHRILKIKNIFHTLAHMYM